MKNFLLSAFFAFVGLFSAFAQTEGRVRYFMGEPIKSEADLKPDGLYFLRAHVYTTAGKLNEGLLTGNNEKDPSKANIVSETNVFASGYTDNDAQVWQLSVIRRGEEGFPEDASSNTVFSLKNLWINKQLAVAGTAKTTNYPANGNIRFVTGDDDVPALFTLDPASPDEYHGDYTENQRFFMQLTNGLIAADNYPFIHLSGAIKYGKYNAVPGTVIQFDIMAAEKVYEVDVNVVFPSFNGQDLGEKTVPVLLDRNPSAFILDYVNNEMEVGGFVITGVKDAEGNDLEVVKEAGQTIYVEGTWDRELKTNQVYRLRFCPDDDDYGALRYMVGEGTAIETKREGSETLNRLVAERLWFFDKVDGKYLLRSLYYLDKAVQFTKVDGQDDWDEATATLADEGTLLELYPQENGDFLMKIAGTEHAWLSDRYSNLLTIFDTEDAQYDEVSLVRLYPLTDSDYAQLATIVSQSLIDDVKADPTIEKFKTIIDEYNSLNIEAALKRVEYFIEGMKLGDKPGEYSDPNGKFVDAVNTLKELAGKIDLTTASDEEKAQLQEAIDAVNKLIEEMSPEDLVLNGISAGVFYRFKAKSNGRYISALSAGVSGDYPAMALTSDNERSNTVFYVQPAEQPGTFTVISFENGLVLPSMKGSALMPTLHGSADAAPGVIFKADGAGGFFINVDPSGSRYLQVNSNEELLSAGSNTSGNSRWFIERVEELPLTFYNVMGVDDYDDGWSSVYSPVALQIPANYERTTAFTGILDFKNYNNTTDINHVLATPIAPNEDGTITIPANQPTLLYYDGKKTGHENPNVNESLIDGREHISYINVPILYGESTPVMANATTSEQDMLPLYGSYFAIPKSEETDYYTLHASHTNNFREYGEYETGYSYVPGFKAYISKEPDEITQYPICQINPNIMAPADTYGVPLNNNYVITETSDDSQRNIKIILDYIRTTSGTDVTYNCQLYYKYTPVEDFQLPEKKSIRRIVSHDDYEVADRDGKEHSFNVPVGSQVDYYVYHPETDTKSAPRTFTLNSDGSTVEIKEVINGADEKVERYDLQGRKLIAPIKGINIVNGKKILVK